MYITRFELYMNIHNGFCRFVLGYLCAFGLPFVLSLFRWLNQILLNPWWKQYAVWVITAEIMFSLHSQLEAVACNSSYLMGVHLGHWILGVMVMWVLLMCHQVTSGLFVFMALGIINGNQFVERWSAVKPYQLCYSTLNVFRVLNSLLVQSIVSQEKREVPNYQFSNLEGDLSHKLCSFCNFILAHVVMMVTEWNCGYMTKSWFQSTSLWRMCHSMYYMLSQLCSLHACGVFGHWNKVLGVCQHSSPIPFSHLHHNFMHACTVFFNSVFSETVKRIEEVWLSVAMVFCRYHISNSDSGTSTHTPPPGSTHFPSTVFGCAWSTLKW